MTSQNFAQIIGLKDDADISVAGTRFIENVREYITFVENNPPEEGIEKEKTEVTVLYQSFFPYSVEWAKNEREKRENEENHPEALGLKDKGSAAVGDLQNNLIEFALCYMRIHWVIGLINAEMMKTPEPDEKDVEWTGETGVLLGKYRKQRKQLLAANETLSTCNDLLETINPQRAAVEKCAVDLMGEELANKTLSPYRSGLRTGNFEKARKALASAVKAKKKFAFDKKKMAQKEDTMKAAGEAYIAFLEEHQDILRASDDKLYLKPSEVSVLKHAHDRELEKKEEFIKKYFRPFLNHQVKTLKYLRKKLLVLGSLENLMTLYIRMMRGIAEPMPDIKTVRLYESEVIEHVTYLLGGQFQEVKNIESRIEEILQEFNISVHDYEAVKE